MKIPEEYTNIKTLDTGVVIGLMRFAFTTGLVVGLTPMTYDYRFCYANHQDAVDAITSWDGTGDPPGNWIKEKGCRGERHNPMTFRNIDIVSEYQQ